MSEIDCVNDMLLLIGEAPVVTLDDLTFAEASIAHRMLLKESLDFQQGGAYWNTTFVTLSPTVDGFIYCPEGTLRMDPVDIGSYYMKVGNRLYDTENNTFVIPDAVEVEIIQYKAWDEIPEVVRSYLTIKAARKFATRLRPDRVKLGYTQQEELEAKAAVMSDEAAHSDSTVWDNWASEDTLDKTRNPVRRRLW
jgi:hypothetical protein